MAGENQKPEQSLFVRFWKLAGWIWVGLVVSFTVGPRLPTTVIIINEAGKIDFYSGEEVRVERPWVRATSLGHISAYALLMWWFAQLRHRKQYLRVAVLFLLMGAGLELLQGVIPHRSSSATDMMANFGGTIFGWLLALMHSQICFSGQSLTPYSSRSSE